MSGWSYNQAKYFRAKNLLGDWEDMGDDEHTTFCSQTTYIFRVEGRQAMYIHMAERHNIKNFLHCSYIWLPICFRDDHTLELTYKEEWML